MARVAAFPILHRRPRMTDATDVASQRDASLLRAMARGDEGAIETFYRAYGDPVLRFIYRRVPQSFEDAQEITHDTFLTALNLASNYRGDASAYGWVCGIARIRIVDHYRRQGRGKRIPQERIVSLDEVRDLRSQAGEPSAADEVDALLRTLSADEREAMMMRYVDELSIREIAQILRRSEKAIENLIARAKEKQRKAIERDPRLPGREAHR